jgi:hypothetical protein
VPGDEEEEMEHQEEGQEHLSETEGSGDDDLGGDPNESIQKKIKGQTSPRRLFTFSLVNSYGTADINSLGTDGKLLKLNCKHALLTFQAGLWGFRIYLKILVFHTHCMRLSQSPCGSRSRNLYDHWIKGLFQRPPTPPSGFSPWSLVASEEVEAGLSPLLPLYRTFALGQVVTLGNSISPNLFHLSAYSFCSIKY